MVQGVLQVLQILLTSGNIIVLLVAFGKFLGKPHKSLEDKYNELKARIEQLELNEKKMGDSIENDKAKFNDVYETIEVILQCTLALVEVEVQRCQSERKEGLPELTEAKKSLHNLLVKRSRDTNA